MQEDLNAAANEFDDGRWTKRVWLTVPVIQDGEIVFESKYFDLGSTKTKALTKIQAFVNRKGFEAATEKVYFPLCILRFDDKRTVEICCNRNFIICLGAEQNEFGARDRGKISAFVSAIRKMIQAW